MSSVSNSPDARKSHAQINVLLVQSNPADSLLTMEAFKAAGLTEGLHCVSDGDDALSYLMKNGQYAKVPSPDVVFLDLSQPRVSGLEVLKLIKSTPELMHIPKRVANLLQANGESRRTSLREVVSWRRVPPVDVATPRPVLELAVSFQAGKEEVKQKIGGMFSESREENVVVFDRRIGSWESAG